MEREGKRKAYSKQKVSHRGHKVTYKGSNGKDRQGVHRELGCFKGQYMSSSEEIKHPNQARPDRVELKLQYTGQKSGT